MPKTIARKSPRQHGLDMPVRVLEKLRAQREYPVFVTEPAYRNASGLAVSSSRISAERFLTDCIGVLAELRLTDFVDRLVENHQLIRELQRRDFTPREAVFSIVDAFRFGFFE